MSPHPGPDPIPPTNVRNVRAETDNKAVFIRMGGMLFGDVPSLHSFYFSPLLRYNQDHA